MQEFVDKQQFITLAIKRLGLFNAFFGAGVLYNSIVFRVVAGVLGGIPPESIALITLLEYWVNFVLDVPLGFLADKVGRVRCTIAGIWFIGLGLSCCYLALLVDNPVFRLYLIVADGVCLGIGRSLMSGSFQAFYEDAIRKVAGSDKQLLEMANASFTKSSEYGRHFYLIATAIALPLLYLFDATIGAKHCFIVGIAVYIYVIVHITKDYHLLGEKIVERKVPFFHFLTHFFLLSRRCRDATVVRAGFQLISSVIAGYLMVTLMRHAKLIQPEYFWPLLTSYTVATGLANSIKGYTLRHLYSRLGEKRYVICFYLVHAVSAWLMYLVQGHVSFLVLCIAVFFYAIFFNLAQSALALVSVDMLNAAVSSDYRATALSIFNMPGFFMVGLYSLYLALYGGGAPGLAEIFITAGVIGIAGVVAGITLRTHHSRTHSDGGIHVNEIDKVSTKLN